MKIITDTGQEIEFDGDRYTIEYGKVAYPGLVARIRNLRLEDALMEIEKTGVYSLMEAFGVLEEAGFKQFTAKRNMEK